VVLHCLCLAKRSVAVAEVTAEVGKGNSTISTGRCDSAYISATS